MFEQPSLPCRASQSNQHSSADRPERLTQNHRADSLRGGADGDADSDLAAALSDRVRRDAVNSRDGEQQRESAEEEKHGSAEARHGYRFVEALLKSLGVEHRHFAIDGLYGVAAGGERIAGLAMDTRKECGVVGRFFEDWQSDLLPDGRIRAEVAGRAHHSDDGVRFLPGDYLPAQNR